MAHCDVRILVPDLVAKDVAILNVVVEPQAMTNDEHGVEALGGLTRLSLRHLAEFPRHLSCQALDPMCETF